MRRSGQIFKLRGVVRAVGDAHQVAVGVILVADSIAHRVNNGCDKVLRIALDRDPDPIRVDNPIVAERERVIVRIADRGKLSGNSVDIVGTSRRKDLTQGYMPRPCQNRKRCRQRQS